MKLSNSLLNFNSVGACLAFIVIAFFSSSSHADDSELTPLFGSWLGQGKLFGMDAQFAMHWESRLNGKFVHLKFHNSLQDNTGATRKMNAEAFYKKSDDGSYSGTWYDSRGVAQPVVGTFTDNVLSVQWGTEETEQGRTSYTVHSDNTVTVVDSVLRGDTWHEFGSATYTSASAGSGEDDLTGRITGIGGVFFRSADRQKLMAWYKEHLGVNHQEFGYAFLWKELEDSSQTGYTVWGPFSQETKHFGDGGQQYMINYRVANIDSLIPALREAGIEIVGDIESHQNGKFAWIKDLEGRKVELWEPIDSREDPYLGM